MQALNLSPFDANAMPTLTMINEIGGVVEMEREEFWDCAEIALDRVHKEIMLQRKKK